MKDATTRSEARSFLLSFRDPRFFPPRAFDSCAIYHHEATDLRKNEDEDESAPFLFTPIRKPDSEMPPYWSVPTP